MQVYDIAIIGGGIAGLSLAYFLGGKRSVVVLEREDSLGYHSTGRSAAEPTSAQTPTVAERTAGIASVSTRTPLGRIVARCTGALIASPL